MHFGFMNVILLYSDRRNVSATHGQLQDGKYKNTNIFMVCWDHCTVRIIHFCL